LVCLVVATLLPFALQHWAYVAEQYKVWVHYLSTEDRQRGPISDWYRDLRAVWRIYIAPMSVLAYFIVELVSAAVIALVALLGRLQNWPRGVLLGTTLSLACCWMTALGPATESATYILLAPTVAWMLIESSAQSRDRAWRIAYGIVFGLFVASQCALWFGDKGKWFRDRLQPLPVAGTLLFIVLLADATRRLRWCDDRLTSENV
jgi:putative Ca2+/H+ antiporter (TMEM165/GDT1 family)